MVTKASHERFSPRVLARVRARRRRAGSGTTRTTQRRKWPSARPQSQLEPAVDVHEAPLFPSTATQAGASPEVAPDYWSRWGAIGSKGRGRSAAGGARIR